MAARERSLLGGLISGRIRFSDPLGILWVEGMRSGLQSPVRKAVYYTYLREV